MPLDLTDLVLMTGVVVFTAALVVADRWTGTIPNKLTYPFFGMGLIFQIVFHPYAASRAGSLLNAGAAFVVGFGLLLVLFALSVGSAGGVKMMGALTVWLGLTMTLVTLGLTGLILVACGIGEMQRIIFLGGGKRRTARNRCRISKMTKSPRTLRRASCFDRPPRRRLLRGSPWRGFGSGRTFF